MITRFGKRALASSAELVSFGALELYGYYTLLPEVIMSNFNGTKLEEKPNLSKPVLVTSEEMKFVFAHRGGKAAVEAIMKDTFTNNKLMRRAVALQFLTFISVTIAAAKSRRFLVAVSIVAIFGNCCHTLYVASSGVRLYFLSASVFQGDKKIWENLNEARYVQRMEEIYGKPYFYARNIGFFAPLVCICYFTPLIGFCLAIVGKTLSLHKRFQ